MGHDTGVTVAKLVVAQETVGAGMVPLEILLLVDECGFDQNNASSGL